MKKARMALAVMVCMAVLCGCHEKGYSANTVITVNKNDFIVNHLELRIKAKDIRNEVKPKNPQGYYTHYKKKDGYHYHVLYGTLKNIGNKKININQIKVSSSFNNEVYEGKLVLINEIESYFWDEIESGVELNFYLFSIVDNEQQDPDEYHLFYDEDNIIKDTQKAFDYEIKYKIDNNLEVNKDI